ncbi:MAG: 4Fe-4S dicluster domain-containing protein [Proteobacteria bacterium]|nr:4Fe-4S dicluster domain-containing protein [Pseudomonadota bacterium]
MARYGMTIDLTTCVACDACVLACKMENDVPDGYARDWTEQILTETPDGLNLELFSNRCHHCKSAPCVAACPTGASYVKDGIVLIDKDLCVGCRQCISGCPYGARYYHPASYVDKCTYCDHRIGTGRKPACVEVCPTNSLVFGDMGDRKSEIYRLLKKRKSKMLKAEKNTQPKYAFLLPIYTEHEASAK